MVAFFLGLLSGFAVSFGGRLAWEMYAERLRKGRLIRALLTDCVRTLRKFDPLMKDLESPLGESGGNDEFDRVRNVPCGFIIDPPLLEIKELIFMLDSQNARPIISLFDHWTRFRIFEERFAETYAKLVDILARRAEPSHERAYYAHLKQEYWSQVEGMRATMHRIATDLRIAAARQFKFASKNLRVKVHNRDLAILSDGYWSSWEEFHSQFPMLKGEP